MKPRNRELSSGVAEGGGDGRLQSETMEGRRRSKTSVLPLGEGGGVADSYRAAATTRGRDREVQGRLTAVAEILARAYLRLAEKQRHAALFGAENQQKPLEVCAPESPDDVTTPEVAP